MSFVQIAIVCARLFAADGMVQVQIEELEFDISGICHGPDEQPRSAGLHLSHIIRDIANSVLYKGERQPFASLSPEEQRRGSTYQAGGFAWERMLERSFYQAFENGSIVRPGEITVDGIHCTPDLFNLETSEMEEWKATWKSMKKCDDLEGNFREWFWQIKGYLHGLGLNVCNLRIYFVNGNYSDSGPAVRCFRLEFTDREIDDNWRMIVGHARAKGWL